MVYIYTILTYSSAVEHARTHIYITCIEYNVDVQRVIDRPRLVAVTMDNYIILYYIYDGVCSPCHRRRRRRIYNMNVCYYRYIFKCMCACVCMRVLARMFMSEIERRK